MSLSGFILRLLAIAVLLATSPQRRLEWAKTDPLAVRLQREAAANRVAGKFQEAESVYQRLAALAERRDDRRAVGTFTLGQAAAQLAQGRYGDAIASYQKAREFAVSAQDYETLTAVGVSLISLYQQTGDPDTAIRAGEAVLAIPGLEFSYYSPELNVALGDLYVRVGDQRAEKVLINGIEGVRARNDKGQAAYRLAHACLEARAWDFLGSHHLNQGALDKAGDAIRESFRLRRLSCGRELALSYGRLADYFLRARDFNQSRTFVQAALRSSVLPDASLPRGELLELAARIEAGSHNLRAAEEYSIEALSESVRSGLRLPSRNTLYSGRETASARALRTYLNITMPGAASATPQAIRAAFERQESLKLLVVKDDVSLSRIWRAQPVLQQIKRSPPGLGATEMEARLGEKYFSRGGENFSWLSPLSNFQHGLRDTEVLYSFSLTQERGFVWVVTNKSIDFYVLPDLDRVRSQVADFRAAVLGDSPSLTRVAESLYQTLFGAVRSEVRTRPDWLLSLDGDLFQIPFAALRDSKGYLIESHSLTLLPAGFFGPPDNGPRNGKVLAIADPIYNSADRRAPFSFFPRGGLPRLPGTIAETDAISSNWTGRVQRLDGANATVGRFRQEANTHPSIIHLATHVVNATGVPSLAFGLDATGVPETLSAADVGLLHTPNAMVVMTGCDSANATTRPGEGLLGLARAWTLAGASHIAGTLWPVRDTNTSIIGDLYHNLQLEPPAQALRTTQLSALRYPPSVWAGMQMYAGLPTGGLQ